MFDIANYWLDDTKDQMRETAEQREGKRWFVAPRFFHSPWDPTKPFVDEQGRALEALDAVRFNDINGPLADEALFRIGRVRLFNEEYRDADDNFSQLVQMHPNSKYAPQAVMLAIFAKTMSTGGSDYDGRKLAEARKLVHEAQMKYPQLAGDKWLESQLIAITLQQAEKDYKEAEFYRRTGKPCPAYFKYEVVRRRYPGTKFAAMATEQMEKIRAKVEKENGGKLPVPEGTPLAPAPTSPQPGSYLLSPAATGGQRPQGELPPPRQLPPNLGQ